jgi:non-homologous end joining protein Ku
MVAATRELRDKGDMDNADAVIQVSAKANPRMYSEMKEDDNVCEALRELMKPEFDEAIAEAKEETKKEEVSNVINILAQLKDGIQKERLIEQGYDEQIVEQVYCTLFQ